MIVTGTTKTAEANVQHFDLDRGFSRKHTFIRSAPDARPGPNAYLIKQSPNSLIRPHFHHASQFQVIVGGSGTIGRHSVRPLTVHHAGQHTGYGPLVAGAEGLWYFTLRAVTESGAWFMPESREANDLRIPKTQRTTQPIDLSASDALRGRCETTVESLITPQPGGLATWLMRIPPGAAARPPRAENTVGRFYLVVGGTACIDNVRLGNLEVAWVSDEDGFGFEAGDDGVEMLVLQFPVDAWQFDTRPAIPPAWSSGTVVRN